MPGQATAYKIGMMKILELREAAKKQMGSRFNIKGFHDTVLRGRKLFGEAGCAEPARSMDQILGGDCGSYI